MKIPRSAYLTVRILDNGCEKPEALEVNRELEENLKREHPIIMKDMWGDPKKTCMAWGIECDDGWYDLLKSLLEKLEYFCVTASSKGSPVNVVAEQVKEKFGTLSFYYRVDTGSSDLNKSIISDIVAASERKSASTCEVSGLPGSLCNKGGWLKTLHRTEALSLGYEPCNPEIRKYWSEDVSTTACKAH
jgi:hypothetical protein